MSGNSREGGVYAQYFDDDGNPLSGGKLYFYESGTSTPKNTYSNEGLSVANANPLILDAAGVPGDIFWNGDAKVVVTDSNDVVQRELDPVNNDPGAGGGGGTDYWTFVFPAKTADFTAVAGSFYFVDISTAGADVTMTLPASPSQGDRVGYAGSSYNINYNVIISGGTKNILFGETGGAATSIEPGMDSGYWGLSLIYDGTMWLCYDSLNVLVEG